LNIILIGMPAAGKSTVGVLLAKELGYGFADTDILITRRAGRTLPALIAGEGISRLLEMEAEVGESLDCDETVIATGGSMVFSARAMERLKAGGVTVYLETPLPVIEARLRLHSREARGVAAPPEMSLPDIYAARAPLYERYADVTVRCGDGLEAVVEQILRAIEGMEIA